MVISAIKRALLMQFGSCVGGISLGVVEMSGTEVDVAGSVPVITCGVSVGDVVDEEQAVMQVSVIAAIIRERDLSFISDQPP
jgi:hypothetical protein